MRPTITTRLAVIVPHKHVPLIRFLGPRRLVEQSDSAKQVSGTTPTPAGNVSDYPIFDYASLPPKYKTPGPTLEEMEAIEAIDYLAHVFSPCTVSFEEGDGIMRCLELIHDGRFN